MNSVELTIFANFDILSFHTMVHSHIVRYNISKSDIKTFPNTKPRYKNMPLDISKNKSNAGNPEHDNKQNISILVVLDLIRHSAHA